MCSFKMQGSLSTLSPTDLLNTYERVAKLACIQGNVGLDMSGVTDLDFGAVILLEWAERVRNSGRITIHPPSAGPVRELLLFNFPSGPHLQVEQSVVFSKLRDSFSVRTIRSEERYIDELDKFATQFASRWHADPSVFSGFGSVLSELVGNSLEHNEEIDRKVMRHPSVGGQLLPKLAVFGVVDLGEGIVRRLQRAQSSGHLRYRGPPPAPSPTSEEDWLRTVFGVGGLSSSRRSGTGQGLPVLENMVRIKGRAFVLTGGSLFCLEGSGDEGIPARVEIRPLPTNFQGTCILLHDQPMCRSAEPPAKLPQHPEAGTHAISPH